MRKPSQSQHQLPTSVRFNKSNNYITKPPELPPLLPPLALPLSQPGKNPACYISFPSADKLRELSHANKSPLQQALEYCLKIWGPAMVNAANKGHKRICFVVPEIVTRVLPYDYEALVSELVRLMKAHGYQVRRASRNCLTIKWT